MHKAYRLVTGATLTKNVTISTGCSFDLAKQEVYIAGGKIGMAVVRWNGYMHVTSQVQVPNVRA